MRLARYITFILLFAASAAGCGASDQTPDDAARAECASDADCVQGFEYCDVINAVCVVKYPPCDDAGNCPPGAVCTQAAYDFPLCLPKTDGDFEGGEVDGEVDGGCTVLELRDVDGACVSPECRIDDDCRNNRMCDKDHWACKDRPSCTPPCIGSEVCINQTCVVKECARDEECNLEMICVPGLGGRMTCDTIVCAGDQSCRGGYVCTATGQGNGCLPE